MNSQNINNNINNVQQPVQPTMQQSMNTGMNQNVSQQSVQPTMQQSMNTGMNQNVSQQSVQPTVQQPMNTGMNQNVSQQPVQPTVQQPMNTGMNQNVSQQPVQPTIQQPMNTGINQNVSQQPVQPTVQQPMNTGINLPPVNSNDKSKKIIYIVVSILVIFGAFLVLNCFFSDKDETENKKTINEYEEVENNDDEKDDIIIEKPNNNSNSNDSDSYTFSGFKFKKVSGYQYLESEGMLLISKYDLALGIRVENFDMSDVKENIESIKTVISDEGFVLGNHTIEDMSGKEVIFMDMSKDGVSGMYFILEIGEDYVIEGVVTNNLGISNSNDINKAVDVIGNPTYVGNYSSYSTHLGDNINKLFK